MGDWETLDLPSNDLSEVDSSVYDTHKIFRSRIHTLDEKSSELYGANRALKLQGTIYILLERKSTVEDEFVQIRRIDEGRPFLSDLFWRSTSFSHQRLLPCVLHLRLDLSPQSCSYLTSTPQSSTRRSVMDSISQSRRASFGSSAPRSPLASPGGSERHGLRSPTATSSRSYSLARSLSSISTQIISASELASSDSFDVWRRGTPLNIPLSVGGGSRWDAFPVPPAVKDLGNYLLDVSLPEWLSENKRQNTILHATTLPGPRQYNLVMEDDTALKSSIDRIEEEVTELVRLHSQQMKSKLNWRIPVDNIIRKAFVIEHGLPNVPNATGCDFICDLVLDVPYSRSQLGVETTVVADAVIATSLYPSPSMFDLDSQVFEELRVDKETHDSTVVCIPHLLVKHRNGLGESVLNYAANELQFFFGACMMQRNLLGFGAIPVFGIACNAGKARAFASYWKDEQIQIVRLYQEDFDLQSLEQASLFFLLLLRIQQFIALFATELQTVDGAAVEQRIKASPGSWKAHPTYPAPPGTSWWSNKSSRSMASSSSSPVTSRRVSPVSSMRRERSSTSPIEFAMDIDESPGSTSEHTSESRLSGSNPS